MSSSTLRKVLGALRLVIGIGAWVAPDASGRLFGLDPRRNPQARYVGRLFGVRDAALGVGLLTTDGDARRRWWQLGVVCDLFDAAAGVLAGRKGDLATPAAAMVTSTALMAAGIGAAALVADDA